MATLKKCVISRYDKSIKKPPYKTIPIDKVNVYEPDNDDGGVEFAMRLRNCCREKGYYFKFYTTSSDENFDYELVVE